MSIINKIFNSEKIFKYSKEEQIRYMGTLDSPKDDLFRSINQYKCQMFPLGIIDRLFLNCAGLIYLLYLSLFFNKKRFNKQSVDSLIVFCHQIENVPESEIDGEYVCIEDIEGLLFDKELKKYYKSLKKKVFMPPYFWCKVKHKLMFYNYLLNKYGAKKIITSNEYSFTSSIMTNYCEENGIKHINVMHGEKLFSMSDSYFRFSKMYVWNDYYIRLFNELNADMSNSYIFFPERRFAIENLCSEKEYDLTYYLQDQDSKEMKKIRDILYKLKNMRISIRPHPRYINMEECRKIFRDFNVEDSSVNINTSLSRTSRVVAIFSTVLLQADYNNIEFFIDDLSNKDYYNKLEDLEYFYSKGKRLSDLIKLE